MRHKRLPQGQKVAANVLDNSEGTPAIAELAIVALRRSLACKEGVLPEGTRGIVVHVYRGGAAYEVEFSEPFACVLTLMPDDIGPE